MRSPAYLYGHYLTLKIEFFFCSSDFNSLLREHHVQHAQTIVEQKKSIFRVRYKAIYTKLLIFSILQQIHFLCMQVRRPYSILQIIGCYLDGHLCPLLQCCTERINNKRNVVCVALSPSMQSIDCTMVVLTDDFRKATT